MNIYLFGGNSTTGKFFTRQSNEIFKDRNIIDYSRKSKTYSRK